LALDRFTPGVGSAGYPLKRRILSVCALDTFVARQATQLRMRSWSIDRRVVTHIVQTYNESIIPVQEIIAIWHSDSKTSLVVEWGEGERK
jgi:hypothetical protein